MDTLELIKASQEDIERVINIVKEHNGSLRVKSKLGEGMAMSIELPIDKS